MGGVICFTACQKESVELVVQEPEKLTVDFKMPDIQNGVLVFEELLDAVNFASALSDKEVQASFKNMCDSKGFLSLQEAYNVALFNCGESAKNDCSDNILIEILKQKIANTKPSFLASIIDEDGILIASGVTYKFSDLKQQIKKESSNEWETLATYEIEELSNRAGCGTYYATSAVNSDNNRKLIYRSEIFHIVDQQQIGTEIKNRWINGCVFTCWPEKKSWFTWNNYNTDLNIEVNVRVVTNGYDANGFLLGDYNVVGAWSQNNVGNLQSIHELRIGDFQTLTWWNNNQDIINKNKLNL